MQEKLNKLAHEAMERGRSEFTQTSNGNWISNGKIPDYCHDLNAAADLERFTIEKVGTGFYVHHLCMAVFSDGLEEGHKYHPLEIASRIDKANELAYTATAEQRVRGCFRALGIEI